MTPTLSNACETVGAGLEAHASSHSRHVAAVGGGAGAVVAADVPAAYMCTRRREARSAGEAAEAEAHSAAEAAEAEAHLEAVAAAGAGAGEGEEGSREGAQEAAVGAADDAGLLVLPGTYMRWWPVLCPAVPVCVAYLTAPH